VQLAMYCRVMYSAAVHTIRQQQGVTDAARQNIFFHFKWHVGM